MIEIGTADIRLALITRGKRNPKLKSTNIRVRTQTSYCMDSSQKQSKEITKYVEMATIWEYCALLVMHHEYDIFVSKK